MTNEARDDYGGLAVATLGGGSFWCLDAPFRELRGVKEVVAGYAGGHVPNPSYRAVCEGETGHAQVVRVAFDPRELSYRDLLTVFFAIHDPTTPDRQGPDVGPQYRSVIFHHSPAQRAEAERVIADLEGVWDAPILTELAPAPEFYPAETFHQDYYARNATRPYCEATIAPKVARVRRVFGSKVVPASRNDGDAADLRG